MAGVVFITDGIDGVACVSVYDVGDSCGDWCGGSFVRVLFFVCYF